MHIHFPAIKIDGRKLLTGILTFVASGALAQIAPPKYQPYALAAGGLALMFQDSPADRPAEALAAVEAVTPLLPEKYQAPVKIAEEVAGTVVASAPTAPSTTPSVASANFMASGATPEGATAAGAVIAGINAPDAIREAEQMASEIEASAAAAGIAQSKVLPLGPATPAKS